MFNMATVPREKDLPVLGAYCAILAAISASLVGCRLALQSGQPAGSRRRWVVGCCAMAAASLMLSIPLGILRVERENCHLKKAGTQVPGRLTPTGLGQAEVPAE